MRGSKKIRLVVVDDHPMVLQGIRMFMAGDPDIHWSGEAATGREALELCRLVEPDVVIVDMRLPDQDGLSLAQQLRQRQPDLQIILISGHLDAEILQQARSVGIHDVLHKEAQAHQLRQVVHRCGQPKKRSAQQHGALTRREIEVLALIGRGLGNQEIVQHLSIAEKTVKVHVNLLVEACHQANPVDLFDAERLLDQYYVSCKQQQQLVPQETSFPDGVAQAVPMETVVIDQQTHLMWSRVTLGSSTLLDIAYFLFQGDSAFGYSGWRLPTVAELQTLGITPGHLQNSAGISFDPTDPWVWTIDTYDAYGGDYSVTTYQTLVNLQDGSRSGEPLTAHATYGDIPYPPASHSYLMVRGPVPQPKGLQITSTAGVGTIQFQAAQLFSDGSGESITDRAVWSVTVQGSSDPGTINSMLHISNSPDSSGLLEIRNLAPSDGVVVSATLHNLTASTTLTQIPPTDATVASILVSPVRTGLRGIDTAPFQLSASAVTQSGVSSDITNQVKWSSSNPAALTVSAQGVATPVLPYGAQTIVTVSATYLGVTGSGKVVIP